MTKEVRHQLKNSTVSWHLFGVPQKEVDVEGQPTNCNGLFHTLNSTCIHVYHHRILPFNDTLLTPRSGIELLKIYEKIQKI